ncbi:hypothetical protein TAMA11512_22870 [Selenomonas sp. TAMA-11512]|uniref:hypothetical protein n=1 Tax=Selenomonas sp. TAMA-11512 TaxID=3095337 RepID=UPI00308D30ED|nr:hypothetical protein TAMA11512_22870 [Selenomonas sp. TAMA-11512]
MMKTNSLKKKIAAGLLAGVFSLGIGSVFAVSAEAAPPRHERQDVRAGFGHDLQKTELASKRRHRRDRDDDYDKDGNYRKGHSQGEVNTAAIIGAVVGAVIAKNT